MVYKIIEALQNGLNSAYTIVEFGGSPMPSPPYIVVKEENDLASRGTAYRVIAHFSPGQQWLLRKAVRNDIPLILNDFTSDDINGNRNKLYISDNNQLPEITTVNDDGTISSECLYFKPDRLYG